MLAAALARHCAADAPPAVGTVCAVHGMGGVGKTTLAVHAAHAARRHFPDGQLHADLRGAGAGPVDPYQVQGLFLRSLGVPAENVPAAPADRAALYRSRLAGRRILLLLDNAVDTAQVEALLPGTAEAAVLVTSRAPLPCLPVTTRLLLEPFDEPEALALLGRIAGPERVAAEPAAARELVRACGLLPLAVRIVAGRLAARPRWSLAALTERLADRARRFTELEAGTLAVEAVFRVGYASLGPDEARAMRLLAIPEVPGLTPPIAAAVLDTDERTAEDLLERLADTGLLQVGEPGRYRFHDLLQLFARHRTLETDPEPERRAALGRLARWYRAGVGAALRVERPYSRLADALDPDGGSRPSARPGTPGGQQWLIEALPGLLALARQILHHPTRPAGAEEAAALAAALVMLMPSTDLSLPWAELLPMGRVLVRTAALATPLPDGPGEERTALLNAHVVRAMAAAGTGHHEEARESAHRARLTVVPGDPVFEPRLVYVRGVVASMHRESPAALAEAIAHYTEASDLARRAGEPGMAAQCAFGAASVHLVRAEPEQAERRGREALELSREAGSVLGTACSLRVLADALAALGRYEEAVARYTEALEFGRTHGLHSQLARTLLSCARTHLAAGHPDRSAPLAARAALLLGELGDTVGAERAREVLAAADGQTVEGRTAAG
ncbi:NB-ARC domain-containing protein [Kitasatospora sp. NPDC054939]